MVSMRHQDLNGIERVYGALSSYMGWKDRPLIRRALEVIGCWDPGLYVVRLPTGYGKTGIVYTYAMLGLAGRCGASTVYASPLRSLADDVYLRWSAFRDLLGAKVLQDVSGLQHSGSPGSIYLNKPVVFTTLDTLALHTFKLPPPELRKYARGLRRLETYRGHYEVSRGALADATVFLDEPHLAVQDEATLKALLALVQLLLKFRSKVVLVTATLPSELRSRYLNRIAEDLGRMGLRFGELSYGDGGAVDPAFEEEQSAKRIDTRLGAEGLEERLDEIAALARDRRVLVVVNSRRRAVALYSRLSAKLGTGCLVLHGFMTPHDRGRILGRVKKLSEDRDPFVLVTTQVVEAGFDASFDALYTELAPAASLVQRAGRVARWEGDDEGLVEIAIPPSSEPYSEDELEAVKKLLVSAEDVCWRTVRCGGRRLNYVELVERASRVPRIAAGYIDFLQNIAADPVRLPTNLLKMVIEGRLLRSANIFPLYVEGRLDHGEIGVDDDTLNRLASRNLLVGLVVEGREDTGEGANVLARRIVETLRDSPLRGWVEMVSSRVEGFLISKKTYEVLAYGAPSIP